MKKYKAVYISDEASNVLRAAAFTSFLPMGALASDCIIKCLKPKPVKPKKRRPTIIYNAKV